MAKRPLKIGFDLDGVLLYNPARIARPIIANTKQFFFGKEKKKFHFPNTPLQQFIWRVLHISSMFIAPGYDKIQKLVSDNKIEAYIITARYSFLKKDFVFWQRRLQSDVYFKECYCNDQDDQPHLYKERLIRELDLDYFIEDNWDIVEHLAETFPDKKIYWIYNMLDRKIDYPYKFPYLHKALEDIIANENLL